MPSHQQVCTTFHPHANRVEFQTTEAILSICLQEFVAPEYQCSGKLAEGGILPLGRVQPAADSIKLYVYQSATVQDPIRLQSYSVTGHYYSSGSTAEFKSLAIGTNFARNVRALKSSRVRLADDPVQLNGRLSFGKLELKEKKRYLKLQPHFSGIQSKRSCMAVSRMFPPTRSPNHERPY